MSWLLPGFAPIGDWPYWQRHRCCCHCTACSCGAYYTNTTNTTWVVPQWAIGADGSAVPLPVPDDAHGDPPTIVRGEE